MPGNQLYGVTENMHHMSSLTAGRADTMSSSVQQLNNNLEGSLRAGWVGSGGSTFFNGHGMWNGNTNNAVVNYGHTIAELQRGAANQYDYTDGDVQGVQNGVGAFSASGSIGAAMSPLA